MDLNIRGKRALICAGSQGLGKACALALAAEGVLVTITSRNAAVLSKTADEIGAITGTEVTISVGDITTPYGREMALDVCPEPDILVTNSPGPPLGRFASFSEDDWLAALQSNMLAPLALIRAVHPQMRARRFGRIINITSALIKAPSEVLPLSVGARAGLTAAVSWLAREGVADNVTINNLLPEMIETDRLRVGFERMADLADKDRGPFKEAFIATLPAKRLGRPAEFAAMCAFLASSHAGYITNQNILIDGGHYPGLF